MPDQRDPSRQIRLLVLSALVFVCALPLTPLAMAADPAADYETLTDITSGEHVYDAPGWLDNATVYANGAGGTFRQRLDGSQRQQILPDAGTRNVAVAPNREHIAFDSDGFSIN